MFGPKGIKNLAQKIEPSRSYQLINTANSALQCLIGLGDKHVTSKDAYGFSYFFMSACLNGVSH